MDFLRAAYLPVGIAVLIIAAGAWYAFNREEEGVVMKESMSTFTLQSTAFENGSSIPSQFTCDGENASPPLEFSGVPEGTRSLVLLMDDPDVPKQLRPDGVFDHWTLFNISPEATGIGEGGMVGTAGANGAGKNQYAGPCPPPQYEPSEHRYFFRLYALDTLLDLPEGATKAEVLSAMEGHRIAEAELMGIYKRK